MKIKDILTENVPYRLTSTQQSVIAIVVASPTPVSAFDATSGSQNLINARSTLGELGALTVSGRGVSLTSTGEQYASDYNIVDEFGELTDNGSELVKDAQDDKQTWQSTQH